MKTQMIRTVLMSAYLSGMLASSVAPLHGGATLASAITPSGAESAMKCATAGLSAAGFAGTAAIPAAPTPASSVAVAPKATTEEPPISEELMKRLVIRAQASKKDAVLPASLCGVFGLNDGTADIPAKQVSQTVDDGKHFFSVSMKDGSKDIIIAYMHGAEISEIYLTDATGKLRAAAIADATTVRLITNEQAAEKFKAELVRFAALAAKLPPTTGTVGAAGS